MTVATTELSPQVQDAILFLSKKLARVELVLDDLASESGMAFSSVEMDDGELAFHAVDGSQFSVINADNGFQVTQTVYGAAQPEQPDVAGVFDGLAITWDGTFVDGDWDENQIDHVEIHATANMADTLDDQNQIGTFTSSNGGTFNYPWHIADGGRWIHLQAVTTAGEEGTPSDAVFAVPDAVAPTDGLAPTTSPAVTVRSGIKSVIGTWTAIVNPDPVAYDVYARNGSAPTSDPTYLIASTPGTSIVIPNLTDGTSIDSTMDIYVMVVARDADGEGPDGATGHAVPITINTVDITGSAITNGKVAPSAIATANIQAGAITNALIGSGAVLTGNIGTAAITSALIADGTIQTGDIGATQITNALIAANAIATGQIQPGAVNTAQIANDAITAALIAADAVGTSELGPSAVTSAEIAANAVTTAAVLDGAISTLKVANLAITAAQIANTTIVAGKIAADTITANEIAANAITTSELNALAVTAGKIAANTITAGQIQAGTITGTEIAGTTITGAKLVAGTITTTQIAATTIVAGNIAANTITAGQIAALTITAAQIAAGTITATQITAGTITGSLIAAGTITGSLIAAGTILASNIQAGTITGNELAAGTVTANKLSVIIGGGNLLSNSGFENATSVNASWTTTGAITIGAQTGQKVSGVQSVSLTGTVTGADVYISQTVTGALPNTKYTGSAWRYLPGAITGASNANRSIFISDGVSVVNSTTTLVVGATTGVWVREQVTITTGPTSNSVTLRLYAPNGVVYWDCAQVEVGDVATAWAPRTNEILPGTILAGMVAANAIVAGNVAANAITTNEIAANTIIAGDIAATTITAAQIAATTITAAQIAATTITATQIAATTITAAKIAANTITAGQIAAGTITANEIAAGTITAVNIAAGTITSDKMMIGSGINWIANAGLETGSFAPHVVQNTGGIGIDTTAPRSGTYCLALYHGATRAAGAYAYDVTFNGNQLAIANAMPVSPGDVVYAEAWMRSGSSGGTIGLWIDAIGPTGTRISNTQDAGTQGYFNAAGTFVAGGAVAGGTYLKMVTRMTIPAGAVYASLNVGSAACTVGQSYLVDDILMSKQVTGQLIVNGAITSKLIAGDVIGTAASGQRMEMSADNAGGVLKFYTGVASDTAGFINPALDFTAPNQVPVLTIKAPSGNGFNQPPQIYMRSGGHTASVDSNAYLELVVPDSLTGASTNQLGRLVMTKTHNGASFFSIDGSGAMSINGQGIASSWQGTKIFATAPDGTTGTANVRWLAGGQYAQITSLSKFKIDPKQIATSELKQVLDIPVMEWIDSMEYKENKRRKTGLRKIPGVLAEDVERIAPRFADYHDGKLSGVAYDRLGLALIPLVKDLYNKIEALETELTARR